MSLSFSNPFWLLLLAAIVPAVLSWRRHLASPGVPRLVRAVTFLRGTALLLLVLALAGLQWMARQHAVDLWFVVDVSESIAPAAQKLGLEFVRSTTRQLRRHDRAGLIAFAREAYMDQPLGARLSRLQRIESTPGRSETDLQAALELAMASSDQNRNVRVVVVSDGVSTRGDAESTITAFQESGIPIDAFALGALPDTEVSVEQVVVPARVGQDQPFGVRVVTASTYETSGRLRLFRNGALIADDVVPLRPGRNVFDFTGFKERSGVNTFEAHLEAPQDTFMQNNAGYATVTVEGPSRLLVITEDASASAALINAMRRQGMLVEVTSAAALPANAMTLSSYGALLLHDVPALKMSGTQLEQIASYVRDLGGGLITVGGHNSYGLGGYYQTPLEEILPLAMDVAQTLVMPSLALVLVLDKSGSMAERQERLSKIDLAKEAALGVLDVVTDRDLLGVVAFDSEPSWVVPLRPATERALMAQQIGTLTADGGTDMGPAMLAAYKELVHTQAMVKHVIILSDGQSMEYDFEAMTARLAAAEVTVSTVAIGQDADRKLLESIARRGNGRFYFTEDYHTIPQIFTTEAFVVSRPLAVEGAFQPRVRHAAPFLAGIDTSRLPQLDGYVLTSPKATSTVHLETEDESPILASWRHGLGRVVSFTSGATTTWASDWMKWQHFGSFWSQTGRWVLRPEGSSPLRADFHIREGRAFLVVDALDATGQFVNFLQLHAEVLSPSGDRKSLMLEQTAPGQYQVEFPAGEEGAWLAAVADPSSPGFEQPSVLGTVLPYSSEYRLTGVDSGSLERLSKLTGGKLFSGAQVPPEDELRSLLRHPYPVRTPIPLWPLLLFLTFILFLLDIVLRYLPPGVAENLEAAILRFRMNFTVRSTVDVESEIGAEVSPTETLADDTDSDESVIRLDELVQRRRKGDLSHSLDKIDPAKAAAKYLARLRQARGSKHRDNNDTELVR